MRWAHLCSKKQNKMSSKSVATQQISTSNFGLKEIFMQQPNEKHKLHDINDDEIRWCFIAPHFYSLYVSVRQANRIANV